MNRESFLESVKKQYAEEISVAYIQASHGNQVDFNALNVALRKLMGQAKVEGLGTGEFEELVRAELPGDLSQLEIAALAKKAA